MIGIALEDLLRSPGQIKVLRVLWRSGTPLTGRQVQKFAGLANLAAMQALSKLTDLGVVSRRRAGRSHQYELKRSNWTVSSVISPLLENEEKGFSCLCDLIARNLKGKCLSAYLYGSAVFQPSGPLGDVDLFVLVKTDKQKTSLENGLLLDLGEQVSELFGLLLEPYVVTRKELSRKPVKKLVGEVMEKGHKVCGEDLSEMLP